MVTDRQQHTRKWGSETAKHCKSSCMNVYAEFTCIACWR